MKRHSDSHKRKISNAMVGKRNALGKHHTLSADTKRRIGLAKRGYKNPRYGVEVSLETRKKLKTAHEGYRNWSWKGGVTPINRRIRKSLEYKLWRVAVFTRDGYACRFCGQVGGELHADHIKRFSDYPELRFAIDNGRTLCRECHTKTETYGATRHTEISSS